MTHEAALNQIDILLEELRETLAAEGLCAIADSKLDTNLAAFAKYVKVITRTGLGNGARAQVNNSNELTLLFYRVDSDVALLSLEGHETARTDDVLAEIETIVSDISESIVEEPVR